MTKSKSVATGSKMSD